jgi:hypothetical protein
MVERVEASEQYLVKTPVRHPASLCDLAKQTARETEMATVEVMGKGAPI